MRVEKVLVVDDDLLGREYLSEILIRNGYEVVSASDGQQALARVSKEGYDLVFLDMKMPEMGGMEVLDKRGMSTSIRKGLQTIHHGSAGILIALGDQPFLKTRTINALIRAFDWRENGIIIPSFRGRMGHPVIFHKRYRKELLNLRGDVGGRTVVDRHPEEVKVVPVKSEGVVRMSIHGKII